MVGPSVGSTLSAHPGRPLHLYGGQKQVSDTLFSGGGNAFSKALLIQYPRQGSWTVAFLTGQPGGEIVDHLGGEYVGVYVPTTPNPRRILPDDAACRRDQS